MLDHLQFVSFPIKRLFQLPLTKKKMHARFIRKKTPMARPPGLRAKQIQLASNRFYLAVIANKGVAVSS